MHGYDCYDYGARHSYTALGRFTTPDPLAEKFYDTSPYVLCGGNPVKFVDLDGCESRSWEDKLGDWMRDTFNSHSEIKEAQNLQPIAEGIALTNPVIGITNEVLKISTGDDIYGNNVRTTDNGTNAVTNVRAVADFCEDISDVCDATAVGLAVTGVGLPVAGALARAGTIAGYANDLITVGVDIYEGDYLNAGVSFAGSIIGGRLPRYFPIKNERVNIVVDKVVDKFVDYFSNCNRK